MYSDASMTNGEMFRITRQRRGGFLGLVDRAPKADGGSLRHEHVTARNPWREGEIGVQIGWAAHGQVRIVEFRDSTQVGVWISETEDY